MCLEWVQLLVTKKEKDREHREEDSEKIKRRKQTRMKKKERNVGRQWNEKRDRHRKTVLLC